MNSKVSLYDPGWLPYRIASFVVGQPLWWALERVGIVGDEGILTSTSRSRKETDWWGEYVLLQLVERAADAIMSLQETRTTGPADALYTFEGFRRTFASISGGSNQQLNERDARVLIKYLERERRVLVLDDEVNMIRFDRSAFSLYFSHRLSSLLTAPPHPRSALSLPWIVVSLN